VTNINYDKASYGCPANEMKVFLALRRQNSVKSSRADSRTRMTKYTSVSVIDSASIVTVLIRTETPAVRKTGL